MRDSKNENGSKRLDLHATLARLRLGLLRSDDLPGLATEMLAVGWESPRLSELAGLDLGPFDPRDASDLWEQAVSELNLDLPNAEEAVLTLACPIARQVLEGRLDPIVGAGRIVGIGQCDPDANYIVADFVYPVDVSGYYEHEADLGWKERRRGLRATRNIARKACEDLLQRCTSEV